MAGSYMHAYNSFGNAVETGGDAVETLEEVMWLILGEIGHEKAVKLLHEKFYPMARGEMEPDAAHVRVSELMDSYMREMQA